MHNVIYILRSLDSFVPNKIDPLINHSLNMHDVVVILFGQFALPSEFGEVV